MMNESFNTLPKRFHDRIPKNKTMVSPEPTPGCATGLRGRVAVMEALEVNDEIQDLILHSASEDQIYQVARRNGFMPMKEDAIMKALQHSIPYEEMNAFGNRVSLDDILDEYPTPVDNPENDSVKKAIITSNEDTIS